MPEVTRSALLVIPARKTVLFGGLYDEATVANRIASRIPASAELALQFSRQFMTSRFCGSDVHKQSEKNLWAEKTSCLPNDADSRQLVNMQEVHDCIERVPQIPHPMTSELNRGRQCR
jgi:hypothetical protein